MTRIIGGLIASPVYLDRADPVSGVNHVFEGVLKAKTGMVPLSQ